MRTVMPLGALEWLENRMKNQETWLKTFLKFFAGAACGLAGGEMAESEPQKQVMYRKQACIEIDQTDREIQQILKENGVDLAFSGCEHIE